CSSRRTRSSRARRCGRRAASPRRSTRPTRLRRPCRTRSVAGWALVHPPASHLQDTLVAGVGLCDPRAVEVLVTEGPARVRELVARGAVFDRAPDGQISLTREGGHHADRIAHAGGDATGAEISRALVAQIEAVRDDPGIEVVEHALVLDVLTGPPGPDGRPGRACGVTLHVIGEG